MALNRYNTLFNHPFGVGFDDFFSPSPFLTSDPFELMPVLRNIDRSPDAILRRSSPGFEIHEHEKEYQISVDVPGVKASDMKLELEEDGRVLHLSGGRKIEREGSVSETRFDKKFYVGENVNLEKLKANLADGVLTLVAPKKEVEKPKLTSIPITESTHSDEKKEEMDTESK
ncbi:hypothetical protein FisN_4Lh487 [Fistulifera solaris]|uniref:SHSP domain-containing protein n=1 Tax=Fistulifera solaris TaxID=1519565 RepID=A0A1Z5KDN0_FISSO|nr:hypothetical protein FisN_4Lh487 [Fistulifera solaris]|eukprot:GAX24363.1 hypothetical protein FisN_4Lh487 [Fistulifera solaris]